MNKKIVFMLTLACILAFSVGGVSAKRILFYEVGTSPDYMIENGYSHFKQDLQDRGNDVASITQAGTLTKEKLDVYDVLVLPGFGASLSTEDISAILWFVMQKGSRLWIIGGIPDATNKLAIPFGTTMDTANLKDMIMPIPGDINNYDFLINTFPAQDDPSVRVMVQGVNRLGFYQGSGLFVSGNAHCIASGDSNTFSETGSFPSGSKPCVASAVQFGNGLVVILSDPDLLTDKNIDSFDNKLFGLNIMDWLTMSTELPAGGDIGNITIIIGSLNLENQRLKAEVDKLTKERDYLTGAVSDLNTQLSDVNDQLLAMQTERIGPLSKTNWIIVFVGLCILAAAIILSRRKEKKPPAEATELGYELGEELGDLGDIGDSTPPK
jgi:hypothetical protein